MITPHNLQLSSPAPFFFSYPPLSLFLSFFLSCLSSYAKSLNRRERGERKERMKDKHTHTHIHTLVHVPNKHPEVAATCTLPRLASARLTQHRPMQMGVSPQR